MTAAEKATYVKVLLDQYATVAWKLYEARPMNNRERDFNRNMTTLMEDMLMSCPDEKLAALVFRA